MAKSINKYYKQNLKNTDKQMNDIINSNNKAASKQISSVNDNYAKAGQQMTAEAEISKGKLDQRYQGSYDLNAVSQMVAERQLKEQMANNGLTNAGLNRSQSTAITTARMNADNAVTGQKNADKSSIEQALYKSLAEQESRRAAEVANIEAQNEQNNAAIRNSYIQNAYSSAVDQYNTTLTNESNERIKAAELLSEETIAQINADAKTAAAQISADSSKQKGVADRISSTAKSIYKQKISEGKPYTYEDAVNEATITLAMVDPDTHGIDSVVLRSMYNSGNESVKEQCVEYMKLLYTYSQVDKINGEKTDTKFSDFANYYKVVTGKTITETEAYNWVFGKGNASNFTLDTVANGGLNNYLRQAHI